MKTATRLFLAIVLMSSVVAPTSKVMAGDVDGKKARQVGAYFMAAQFGNKAVTPASLKLVYEIPNVTKNIPALYAFNTADNNGFVIVSGVDCLDPIIAYSTDGPFDPDNIPPAMQWWLGEYANMIACAQNNEMFPDKVAKDLWSTLEEQRLPYFGQNTKAITRLLKTQWNQNYPYNTLCPPCSNGTYSDIKGRAYVGCVATAMSQILRYWKYPRVGQGSMSYHVSEPGVDTTLYADFSRAYYNYDLMPEKLSTSSSSEEIYAVSLLGYHCGISVQMGYDGDGSSAHPTDVDDAFIYNFKYVADGMRFLSRDSYTYNNPNRTESNPNPDPIFRDTNWVNLIVEEILNNRPVYYGGFSPYGGQDAGHAFICDGWNTSTKTLHFNWGWGGKGDCWCNVYTAQLIPSSSPQSGTSYYFFQKNSIIIGITPPQDSIHLDPQSVVEPENPFVSAVYPNPASTNVTVGYKLDGNAPAMLQVYDAAGHMVSEVEVSPVSTQITIPVNNYHPGIYFCRLNGYTQKFVVR